jgi:hypothetical protein
MLEHAVQQSSSSNRVGTRLHPSGNRLAILTSGRLWIERQTGIRSAARLGCQVRTDFRIRLVIATLRVGLDRRRVLLD